MIRQISNVWQFGDLNPFMPTYEGRFRRSGNELTVLRPLFPGYIFIETEIEDIAFATLARKYIRRSDYALKLLRYGGLDNFQYAMVAEERDALLKLCGNDFCVEMSQGFVEGDRVVITSGALFGLESFVTKINRL